jgi:probable rRNA maturation factor
MLQIVDNQLDKKHTKLLKKLYKKTLKLTGQKPSNIEASLAFINEKEMQKLNKETRNIDKTTDVLSFPNLENVFNQKITKQNYFIETNPQTKKVFLGDVIINLNKASEQAKEYNHSLSREVCYLFVHGLLHLLGYDHIEDKDKKLMRSKEELILNKFKLTR